jgi:hypothetical protein
MKNRNLLITLLVLILVAAYIIIGWDYLKQRNQKDELAGKIADTTQALALIPGPPAGLDAQLITAQNNLSEEKVSFTIDTNYIRIVNRILKLAEEAGVKAIPLSTQPWLREKYENQELYVFRIGLAIAGNYTQVAIFLSGLENSEPQTLIIEYLAMNKLPGSSLIEGTNQADLPVTGEIKIAVYSLDAAAN